MSPALDIGGLLDGRRDLSRGGAQQGSFFHYLRSKEDLALAAPAYFSERADAMFGTAPYQSAADARERILGYIDQRAALLRIGITNVRVSSGEGGLRKDSIVLCNQLRAIDRRPLDSRLGTVQPATLHAVESGLRAILDL